MNAGEPAYDEQTQLLMAQVQQLSENRRQAASALREARAALLVLEQSLHLAVMEYERAKRQLVDHLDRD